MLKMKYLTEANLRGFEKYKVYFVHIYKSENCRTGYVSDNPYP